MQLLAIDAAARYKSAMVSDEDLEAVKKRVGDIEDLLKRVALSHKDVLEKYLPEAVDSLNMAIKTLGTSHVDLTNKVTDLMNGMGTLVKTVEAIQDELELRSDLS